MKIKSGRDEYEVSSQDLILDNGACYQLITKRKYSGWNSYPLIIAKTTFKKMLKDGKIRKSKKVYGGLSKNITYPLYKFVIKDEVQFNEKR